MVVTASAIESNDSENNYEPQSYIFNGGRVGGSATSEQLYPLLDKLSKKVRRPVFLVYTGGNTLPPTRDNHAIYNNSREMRNRAGRHVPLDLSGNEIFIWEYAVSNGSMTYESHGLNGELYGYDLHSMAGWNTKPNDEQLGGAVSLPLISDNEIQYGYALENDAYLPLNLSRALNADQWGKVLEDIGNVYSGSWKDILEQREREIEEKSQEIYAELCANRNTVKLRETEQAIRQIDSQITMQRNTIGQLTLNRRNYVDELDAQKILYERKGNSAEKYKTEFETLKRNDKVARVLAYENSRIEVHTKNLITDHLSDGTTRELGEYIIKFTTDGNTPSIKNKTRNVNGWTHPHAPGPPNEYAYPCWGNVENAVYQMNTQFEYAALAAIIIRFLEEPNPDDQYGREIWNWPIHSQTWGKDPNLGGNYGRDLTANEIETQDEIEVHDCPYCGTYMDDDACCRECNENGYECSDYDECNDENGCPCVT